MPSGPTSPEPAWFDEIALPALLRAARATYGTAIRHALAAAGFDDLPRNGPFVLGAIARTGAPLADVIRGLGSSKQAGGQLVDSLVVRGYLGREVDPDDRRRLTLMLTDRGAAAAAVVRSAVDGVDTALAERVGAAKVREARAVLGAVVGLAGGATGETAGDETGGAAGGATGDVAGDATGETAGDGGG